MPQREVIGPLLLIIHIKEIATDIDICSNLNLFAYDTKIFNQLNNILQQGSAACKFDDPNFVKRTYFGTGLLRKKYIKKTV